MSTAISIIIPAYNVEEYIEETIKSIVNQDFQDYEIIIIDDGSRDNTKEVIESCDCDKINYYYQKNQGQSAARNNALQYVKGKYITFIDADDILEKDYLSKLYFSSEENNSDISMCGFKLYHSDTKEILEIRNPIDWEIDFNNGEKHVFHYTPVGKLFRTEFIRKYDFKFSVGEQLEDGPYSVMTDLLAEKVNVLNYTGYLYRMRMDSTTGILRTENEKPKVPYKGIEDAILKVRQNTDSQAKLDVLEFCIIKILAGLTTNMYKNCDKETRKNVCNYCYKIIEQYFPNVTDNKFISVFNLKKLPFVHRCAIKLFIIAYKLKLLYPFSLIVSKIL